MIAPSEPIQNLVHELFSGNQHTLLAKARAEEAEEEKRALQADVDYSFHEIRSVYMTFKHLQIEATVDTIQGTFLSATVEGMVQGEAGLEYVDYQLIEPPPPPDPSQLLLPLAQVS